MRPERDGMVDAHVGDSLMRVRWGVEEARDLVVL